MSSCGGRYVLPRELSLSPAGTLLQHPVKETELLRQGAVVQGPHKLAAGSQVEVLVECTVANATALPSSGFVGIFTLISAEEAGAVQVGYDFGSKTGFASVPSNIGFNNTARTDRTPPLLTALEGPKIKLHIFVDGQIIESFFNGETTITTATNSLVDTDAVTSSFMLSKGLGLDCEVSSWVLGL